MLVMCSGAVGYVMSDAGLEMAGLTAYTWITVYFLVVAVESAYGKHIVGPHLGFGSMWGPTLYTNTISIPPMVAIGLLSGEQEALLRHADCSKSSPGGGCRLEPSRRSSRPHLVRSRRGCRVPRLRGGSWPDRVRLQLPDRALQARPQGGHQGQPLYRQPEEDYCQVRIKQVLMKIL